MEKRARTASGGAAWGGTFPSSLACEQLDSQSGFDLESRVIPLDT